jgi:hypothetical protein
MSKYTIIKGRSGYLIDDGSGSSIRYATKALAEATVARRIRQDAEAIAYAAEHRAARLAEVHAYLAERAERREIAARQFAFNF